MIGGKTMDRNDEQRIVTIVLRCAGILTVVIGLILTTQTVLALIAASSAAANLPRGMNVSLRGSVGKMGGWAIVAQLSISVWGAVLYGLAQSLAGAIVGELQAGSGPAVGNP
jgi:hypothetical protein